MADAITRYDWFYDAYGRVGSREWGTGRITDWARDVQGRITTEATEDDGITMTTASSQFTEYGAPKYVTRTVDGVVESTALRRFDARGRVTRVQQQAGGYACADVQYTRGDDGLVEQVLTPSGTLTYARAPLDRRVTEVRRGASPPRHSGMVIFIPTDSFAPSLPSCGLASRIFCQADVLP